MKRKSTSSQPTEPVAGNIILAEDHEWSANIHRKLLISFGFSVFIAKNWSEVLKLLKGNFIHLVVLAEGFYKASPRNSIAHAKDISKNKATKWTIAYLHKDKEEALPPGIDGCLVEPLPREKLVAQIKHLLEQPARQHSRITGEPATATLILKGNKRISCTLEDLSLTGAKLKFAAPHPPLAVGSQHQLQLAFPQEENRSIGINIAVVRASTEYISVVFEAVSDLAHKVLSKIIHRHTSWQEDFY